MIIIINNMQPVKVKSKMEDDEPPKKSSGFLSKLFVKAAVGAGLFFLSGYAGAMVFDYGSAGNVHSHFNETSLALRNFSEWLLSPFHSFMGTDMAQNGVLQTDFVQNTLGFKKFYRSKIDTLSYRQQLEEESGLGEDLLDELAAEL